jgi:hypothetical protein
MISPSTRALILTTVLATVAGAPSAQAASQFDGNWALHGVTRAGECDPNFRLSGQIVNGNVNYQFGSSNVAGRVAPSGAVTVTVTVGPNHAVGTGRLSKDSGGGTWRSQGPSGTCSGTWSAQRS